MLDKVPGSIKSQRYALNPNADFGFTPLHLAAQFVRTKIILSKNI